MVEGNFSASADKSHGYLPYGKAWCVSTLNPSQPPSTTLSPCATNSPTHPLIHTHTLSLSLTHTHFLSLSCPRYRKRFTLPSSAQGKAIFLDFDGVMVQSQVWLNGNFLGSHNYGYTPFRFDLTSLLNEPGAGAWEGEEQVLVVLVDATNPDSW